MKTIQELNQELQEQLRLAALQAKRELTDLKNKVELLIN